MLADNQFMLEQFREADLIGNFPFCVDLALAGENYDVTKIHYFIKSKAHPLDDYIGIEFYDDNSVFLNIQTRDRELLREGVEYFCAVTTKEQELLLLRTPYVELAEDKLLTDRFLLKKEDALNRIYFIRSKDALAPLVLPEGVKVALATDRDWEELADEEKYPGNLHPDGEHMGAWIFRERPCYKDTKLYLLRENGRVVGRLRAENGIENIYNVGFLAVEPEVRGKGYGTCLTLYFSYDCYAHGFIPHYGYAICPESQRVAEKCGYSRDLLRDRLLCFTLKVHL